MRILFIGDTVGTIGQKMINDYLPALKQQYKPQVTIINGENIADGKGMTQKDYKNLLQAGADAITMGNHTWNKRDILTFIDDAPKLVRPANFPKGTPGQGMTMINVNQAKLAVINLQGRALMNELLSDPFEMIDAMVAEISKSTNCIFIDFHAETTSEKLALAWYLDGRISALVGTHTHVQTNDARVLPAGTAVLTDAGMTGPYNGILGVKREKIINRFKTQRPERFELVTEGPGQLNGCLIEVDDKTGHAKSIKPIQISPDHPYTQF